MAVAHELPGLGARVGKAEPIDGVVKAPFEKNKKVRTCNAFLTISLFKIGSKLGFVQTISPPDLLLLPKLQAIVRELASSLTMLTRGIISALNGAFVRVAPVAFKVELHGFPPAKAAYRIGVTSQGKTSSSRELKIAKRSSSAGP
jgi:hypothetical protein